MKGGFVYILTNKGNNVLYTGVTSDLVNRIIQHQEEHYPQSFSAKYKCKKLLYFETFDDIESAISREKYIKGKSRVFKLDLITSVNPGFNDLWYQIKGW